MRCWEVGRACALCALSQGQAGILCWNATGSKSGKNVLSMSCWSWGTYILPTCKRCEVHHAKRQKSPTLQGTIKTLPPWVPRPIYITVQISWAHCLSLYMSWKPLGLTYISISGFIILCVHFHLFHCARLLQAIYSVGRFRLLQQRKRYIYKITHHQPVAKRYIVPFVYFSTSFPSRVLAW